jgi:hypothetical protein
MLKVNDRNDHNMIITIFIVSCNDRKLQNIDSIGLTEQTCIN